MRKATSGALSAVVLSAALAASMPGSALADAAAPARRLHVTLSCTSNGDISYQIRGSGFGSHSSVPLSIERSWWTGDQQVAPAASTQQVAPAANTPKDGTAAGAPKDASAWAETEPAQDGKVAKIAQAVNPAKELKAGKDGRTALGSGQASTPATVRSAANGSFVTALHQTRLAPDPLKATTYRIHVETAPAKGVKTAEAPAEVSTWCTFGGPKKAVAHPMQHGSERSR